MHTDRGMAFATSDQICGGSRPDRKQSIPSGSSRKVDQTVDVGGPGGGLIPVPGKSLTCVMTKLQRWTGKVNPEDFEACSTTNKEPPILLAALRGTQDCA